MYGKIFTNNMKYAINLEKINRIFLKLYSPLHSIIQRCLQFSLPFIKLKLLTEKQSVIKYE
jgi:hypothetical protein